jgi:glycosyltransferase involved in cell wall biosynthesis
MPNAELVLVGGVYPDMERVISRYDGLYRFVPSVPQPELAALYNSASVFVIPSIEDGFPMAALEAMACGIPVIFSENVGIPITDGQQGFVVPIQDAEAIQEKLTYLRENEAERRAMGERARAFVQQFSWDNYQKRVLELYERLVQSS